MMKAGNIEEGNSAFSKTIIINVAGREFRVSRDQVLMHKDSILAAAISHRPKQNVFFFDQPANVFEHRKRIFNLVTPLSLLFSMPVISIAFLD